MSMNHFDAALAAKQRVAGAMVAARSTRGSTTKTGANTSVPNRPPADDGSNGIRRGGMAGAGGTVAGHPQSARARGNRGQFISGGGYANPGQQGPAPGRNPNTKPLPAAGAPIPGGGMAGPGGDPPQLGSGERFKALSDKLAARPGVKNPGALAAWIGRRKYGGAKMGRMAAAGRAS